MRALDVLDWTEILQKIQGYATSEIAKQEISQLAPLANEAAAKNSFQDTFDAMEVLGQGHRPYMQSLDMSSIWRTRLKKRAVLKVLELKDVRGFCLEVVALAEALAPVQNTWSQKVQGALMDAEKPLSALDQILTPAGDIRSDASETLHRLYKEKERLAREVQTTMDRLVKDHDMDGVVQDKYVTTREGRWVIPVRSGMQHYLPGVQHGSSQSKQTVFIEPEKVVPTNNRLRQIEVEIEDEIERLLTQLSHYLAGETDGFEMSHHTLEQADLRFAQAQFTQAIDGQAVDFSEDTLDLIEVRHPLLKLTGKNVVSNSVSLDQQKSILLLSGPNAGGKTVLLKSIGIAAQMARCGLPICASETSKLPFFKNIHIGIGDAQSVDEELSTFAAHLKILNQSLQLKGEKNLILIDEIAGSTDPEEGSALARSFIEAYSANKVFAVITSHLGPLKMGWTDQDRVLNGSMEYDPKSGRPTYQFLSGIPGDSLAIHTAKRVGVDPRIVERALEVLSPATRARLEGLDQIEKLRGDVNTLQDNLRRETQKALAMKKKYETQLDQLNREKEEWLQKTIRKAEKKIDEAIALAKVDQTFKKHTALQEIKYQLPEIVKAKPINLGGSENAEDFAKRFPTGSKVFVSSLQQDAIVQSAPNSRGEVSILSGSIRLQLPWQDLRPPGKPGNPTSQLVRQSSSFSVALHDEDRVVDLRGQMVDQALSELEIILDKAAHQREDRIKVIHGHGTEALKKAVRTYLSRSIYVKKWKAGTPENGGDGVTWVELGEA